MAAKSWTMLSVLFGYGFALVMNNVAVKILLLFHRQSAKMAPWVSAALVLLVPFVAAYLSYLKLYNHDEAKAHFMHLFHSHNWIDIFVMNLKGTYYTEMINPGDAITAHMVLLVCMLLGFAAQRIDFFNRLAEFKKQLKTVFFVTLLFSVASNVAQSFISKANPDFFNWFKPHYWITLSTMICILCGICWLYLSRKMQSFFTGLQAMGKMTLTNYMMQSILAPFIFLNVGLGIFNTQPYWFYISIALLIFIIQVGFSKWWLSHYNYGPVEWIWRQLSYGKRFPIRKKNEAVSS